MTRIALLIVVVLAALGLAEITNVVTAWSSHQPTDILDPRDLTTEIVSHSLVVLVAVGLLTWMSGWNILPTLGAVMMIGMVTAMALGIGAFMGIIMMAADDPQGTEVIDAVTNSYKGWQFQPVGIYLFAAIGAVWTLWRNFAEDRLLIS